MSDYTGQRVGASPIAGLRGLAADTWLLRAAIVVSAVFACFLFVMVGTGFRLHLYADGSLFSFGIAAQDAWNIHWHNIPGRLTVYLYAHVLPQAVVSLSADTELGLRLYSLLFFMAPLLGLTATWAADRSTGKTLFVFACASTLLQCPLIFGFPTEMWIAHSLFWPALAICHFAGGRRNWIAVFLMLCALIFTHEGALIFAASILLTLALRNDHELLRRAAVCLLAAFLLWCSAKLYWRPDPYVAAFIRRAAMLVFNPEILSLPILRLLAAALAGFGAMAFVLRRFKFAAPVVTALAITVLGLAVYWLLFDRELHGEGRYYLRTAVIVLTPLFGLAASLSTFENPRWLSGLTAVRRRSEQGLLVSLLLCVLGIVTLIHTVEAVKFVREWSGYMRAVRSLSMSSQSDAFIGDPRFVSSRRIKIPASRLAWDSTLPYLSVMITPEAPPRRLVVDPGAMFFWLSCDRAKEIARAANRLPARSKDLLRVYSCLKPRVV